MREVVLPCLSIVLRPIARFCLRHSLKLQDATEILKRVFLDEAEAELRRRDGQVTASKLSVMTGVHRKDVARLSNNGGKGEWAEHVISRVIGQWQQDRRFITAATKKPRTLTVEGEDSEFAKLVHSVSTDLNPYTVLFELERMQAVKRTSQGLKLASRIFIPKGNVNQGFSLVSSDINDLLRAVEENLLHSPNTPNLHIKTEYDHIAERHIPRIKEWFIREGSALHQRARNFLSQFDSDINARPIGSERRMRVVVGSFSFCSGYEGETHV